MSNPRNIVDEAQVPQQGTASSHSSDTATFQSVSLSSKTKLVPRNEAELPKTAFDYIPHPPPLKKTGPVGLRNLGNTGWMNTALQCIRAVPELTLYFLEERHRPDLNLLNPLGYNGEVAQAYATLLVHLNPFNGSTHVPRDFVTLLRRYVPQFGAGSSPADAQEFTGFLLDALSEDLNRVKKRSYDEPPELKRGEENDEEKVRDLASKIRELRRKRNDSVIGDLMEGWLKSTIRCPKPECGEVKITFDPVFMVIVKPFERKANEIRAGERERGTIEAALSNTYSQTSLLPEFDAWYCPGCSSHRRAFQTFDIWSVPDVLIIHIKRFSRSDGVQFVPVLYPVEGLDLAPWVKGPIEEVEGEKKSLLFDLFAVVNHRWGLGGRGYYSAFVKRFEDGKWYDFNDASVVELEEKDLVTDNAYVLFYHRR